MALIERAKGRRQGQAPSGYTRLFGNQDLGNLMSRVQGTVIASGTELEHQIMAKVKHIQDLDDFLANKLHSQEPGVWVATKKQVKNSKIIHSQYEPDFLAFRLTDRVCYVVEVKDGDQFDTKKAYSEHASLSNFNNDIARAIPFSTRIYLCSFNAPDIDSIYNGLKRKFQKDELLTGSGLCDLFEINYDEIIRARNSQQQINLEYFIEQMAAIPEVREIIRQALKQYQP